MPHRIRQVQCTRKIQPKFDHVNLWKALPQQSEGISQKIDRDVYRDVLGRLQGREQSRGLFAIACAKIDQGGALLHRCRDLG